MKKLVALAAAMSILAAVPTSAAPPYKIPPGQYCKGMSKKKIPGEKRTPFAQCVTAMAQINKKPSTSSASACASIKKGAKGAKGKKTAKAQFGKCVSAGNKLKSDLKAGNAA